MSNNEIDPRVMEVLANSADRSPKIFVKEVADKYAKPVIERGQTESFAAGGRPRKWKPLKEAYARRKKRKFGDRPILVRTGALRAAATRTLEVSVRGWRVFVGIAKPDARRRGIAAMHQFGAGRLPVRKVFQVTPEECDELARAYADGSRQVMDYLQKVARGETQPEFRLT